MNGKRLVQSFKDAGKGIGYVFKHEQNFRLQIYFTIIVSFGAWFFKLTKAEIIVVSLLVILVLILELLNSAVERLSDVLKPRLSLQIEIVKDIMAGVVFMSSLGAIIVGGVVFYPHVIEEIIKIW